MLDLPNTYAALAPRLHGAGYAVLPLDGKAPKVPKWSELPITQQQVAQWAGEKPKANIGLRCDQALMVDIDIEDGHHALVEPFADRHLRSLVVDREQQELKGQHDQAEDDRRKSEASAAEPPF